MSRLLVLVEGYTEQTFVREVLAPHLAQLQIWTTARVIGKPGHKGGYHSWKATRRELVALLREDGARFVTTLFDYYALPTDWPGRSEAIEQRDHAVATGLSLNPGELGETVASAISEQVKEAMSTGWNPSQFIPYVQMHEFEGLLFSSPKALAAYTDESLETVFQEIVEECGSPERINDSPVTAPSKRILREYARYEKVVHGSVIGLEIGLPLMRSKCDLFKAWIEKLEALADEVDE